MLKLIVFLFVAISQSGGVPRHLLEDVKYIPIHQFRQTLAEPNARLGLLSAFPAHRRKMLPLSHDVFGMGEEERLNNLSATPSPSDNTTETVFENITSTAQSSVQNSTHVATDTTQVNTSTTTSVLSSNSTANTTADDKEVIIPTTKPPLHYFDSFIQQAITRLNDTYTLSILLPVTAGFVFASVVIVTVAFCNCIRKRCCRRRFKRKVLPESLRNMRQSDREKLLAETSDEEF